jgi:hypothetical protein
MVFSRVMRYVSDSAAKKARDMEVKFQRLPPAAGVLFVSITPTAAEGGDVTEFRVFLGMSHFFDVGTGTSLVNHVLKDEINEGYSATKEAYSFIITVARGVPGARRDEGSARSGQASP